MGLIRGVWYYWLEWPILLVKKYLGLDLTIGWRPIIVKLVLIGLTLLILHEVFLRLKRRLRRLRGNSEPLAPHEDNGLVPAQGTDGGMGGAVQAADDPAGTIAALRKNKQYGRLAQVYASLGRHKEAARCFKKAGDRKRAAAQWVIAGRTKRAAKLLVKEGDYATAARFFAETGDHRNAAVAYAKHGSLAEAAAAYARAGKTALAVQTYRDYFAHAEDGPEVQFNAAQACHAMLESAADTVPEEDRTVLLAAVAARFERVKRHELAARLFREAGNLARAGELYAQAGKLEEAAQCLREAGNVKEADLIGARFYEGRGRWSEAAAAYAAAGEFRRAGDCFGKINDAARAAECYEKAGEFFGAALACSHLGEFEKAIRLLQNIRESDKAFDQSRALLGRCFYELHDYAHCAAALDNHLTGKRVETSNIEYFYMLALAYEQLGKLDKSQQILLKIRSINVGYKDVTQRLSNISSRISMGMEPAGAASAGAMPTTAGQEPQVMRMVENLLGSRYAFERELGRGGMGVVYLARDTQLDRLVALKFLGTMVDDSEESRQRFVREAKAAARVNHPNIISIYDIGAEQGRAFIAMEYVEGTDLTRRIIDKGKLSPREAVNLCIQACSALDAIHQAGIVHRDIKPDNVLITHGGLVKLTDFGLAKAGTARLTASNIILGTPAYMSPEQTRDSDVDARSDIYSMGLVLYEMLTGKCAFAGGNALERQETELPPPPGSLTEGIPDLLNRIVMKCIAKDPAQRYQTAPQLIAHLRQVQAPSQK